MPQEIGNVLKRSARLNKPAGQSMAKYVSAADLVLESATLCRVANCIADDICVRGRVYGRSMADKNLSTGSSRAPPPR